MIRLHSARLFRADLRTRMPFRYGIATMTELPHVFLATEWEIDGRLAQGLASENLPPKWFTKEPEKDPLEEIGEMEAVVVEACNAAKHLVSESPFAFWLALYDGLITPPRRPALLQHLGVSLVERAMLDAFCRHHQTPLWQLVRDDRLGIDLGKLSPVLAGRKPSEFLPRHPLAEATLRHTVGMADPLREADIPAAERLNDGLPQSLEACIAAYALREFKLKLCGDAEADLARLRATAAVLTACCHDGFAFSLDGNEQFGSPGQLRAFGERVMADPALAGFFEHLLFIEQPVSRKAALAPDAGSVGDAWPRPVSIIIDESDGALADLPRALELGYAGVSQKNCKGVFKGIRNRCLLGAWQERHPERRFLMTGEDLANIGPVALLQDLAVQALLGNASIERNGHHYFRGLSAWPQEWQPATCTAHPDLYAPHPAHGWPALQVAAGRIALGSVNAAPFGVGPHFDPSFHFAEIHIHR